MGVRVPPFAPKFLGRLRLALAFPSLIFPKSRALGQAKLRGRGSHAQSILERVAVDYSLFFPIFAAIVTILFAIDIYDRHKYSPQPKRQRRSRKIG